MPTARPQRVLITGAAGNLGRKLIDAFIESDWCTGIVALDREVASVDWPTDERLSTVAADLAAPSKALEDAVADTNAIVHLAAQHPYPDASWADSAASFDMTVNLLEAAASGSRRLVFASSNHVMGGYKDTRIATTPGALTTALAPAPGTRTEQRAGAAAPPAYAVAKLMGERLCAGKAAASRLTAVSLRIGWCQPGENHPATISASGTPLEPSAQDDPQAMHDLTWFRNMWLSNRDFAGIVSAAIRADASAWPARAIVLNAMSRNQGMPWDIEPSRHLIGHEPRDDVWAHLGR